MHLFSSTQDSRTFIYVELLIDIVFIFRIILTISTWTKFGKNYFLL